ncbi:MAG: 16S rRNA (adenine(1518)-N(6)/adenine(1519)-N(6))-dimethyltransferase RsmA [Bdellovibrionota bacterium]|nr:MAG: 16S rRNA (adenine(1518)-N(6)/adenine(1519)-N(6))-dimethyltransferase RsmA [Bdellovibrionota bacterium]
MAERVKDALQRLDIRPTRTRGQNFVIQPAVIDAIISFGAPASDEDLIEIGGGLGALTERLVAIAPRSLTVIEIEPQFCAELKRRFPAISVECADAREVDYRNFKKGSVVFGNLPYSFSTEILFRLVDVAPHLSRAVLLLQREFVDRLASPPGSREYGTISVMAQLIADVRKGPIISGRSFHPPTEVESRVVELRFLAAPRVPVADRLWLRRVVKAAFHQRRKKLSNSLRSLGLGEENNLSQILSGIGIDPGRRAETLSLDEFVKMADTLRALPRSEEPTPATHTRRRKGGTRT